MFVRKILILFFAVILTVASGCRRSVKMSEPVSGSEMADTIKPVIAFNEYEHDFGKVEVGETVGYTFTFENRGNGDLIINSAITTCGCTVPKYSTKPVPPGGKGNLEVIFDTSGRNGMQTKTITVKSNASIPVVLLKITSEVLNHSNQ
jgi:hypothetical protein